MSNTVNNIAVQAGKFEISGNPVRIEVFGSGHINDTYCVETDSKDGVKYLLQRINHHVFQNVEALMQNMALVIAHLKAKYSQQREGDPAKNVLTLIPSLDGNIYFKASDGSYWRMFLLLEGTKSYDLVTTAQQAREGGRAFGKFQRLLADVDLSAITEVIPDFHHIGKRYATFEKALDEDILGRKEAVEAEVHFIQNRIDRMHGVLNAAAAGNLPLRITHNDTKFNNILLDQHDRAQCVIDLDTVMPGYVAYDFGDAIRTIINSAAEDEVELSHIQLNIPLFEAYTKGYFEEAHPFLSETEISSLMDGVLLLPYMQAVRFLTDYLEGDHYFKIHHKAHNLQRARAQLKLVSELERHEQELNGIVTQVANQYARPMV